MIKPEENIIIIGMPGSGKSTFGKALAEKLQRPFYDADTVIEEQEGKTIPELFALSEDCFREAEIRASRTLAAKKGIVVACGGGVIKRPENMEILKTTGIVFFLDRSPEDIISDVDISGRPLLQEGRQRIYDLYRERIGLYRCSADYCVENAKDAETVLKDFLHLVEQI